MEQRGQDLLSNGVRDEMEMKGVPPVDRHKHREFFNTTTLHGPICRNHNRQSEVGITVITGKEKKRKKHAQGLS